MTTYKKSRLVALLLVLVLMMSMIPAAYAAGDVVPDMTLTTNKGSDISPGDTVSFTLDVINAGDVNWKNVKLTSVLEFIEIDAGTVKIDGVTSDYTFTAAGKLTVTIGIITPGATKTVTFDGTVLDNVAAKISYSFTASGYNTSNIQRFVVVASTFTPLVHTSAPPVFNTVREGDSQVTGTGVPSATVTVTLPNNSTYDVPVGADGKWTLDVPAGVTLTEGQIIRASQTEPKKLVSPTVQTTVLSNPNYNGVTEKTSENLTTKTGKAKVGDEIQYTITATNNSTQSSRWACVVTDNISEYVDFIANSVTVGTNTSYPYTYVSRVLTVDLGTIAGGETKTLTFRVKINDKAYDQTIANTALVGGISTEDKDPPIVERQSEAPTINPVTETDDTVTGKGVPDADIVVTFPDGTEVETKVDKDGNWEVEVPDGTTLPPGEDVTAVQTEPGLDPSDEVSTEIQPNPNPIKSLEKKSENLTTRTGLANVNDTIEYTITAKNNGTASSTWYTCTVTDAIPDGVTFVPGSVTINGNAATVSQYQYNSTSHVLTVYLGDIVGGTQRVITFRVTIDSNSHDMTIKNTANVGSDIKAEDPNPPKVKDKSPTPIIDDVIEAATTVTGEGVKDVPGTTITVTFPDGTRVSGTVDPVTGEWTVNVPSNVTLKVGDEITAVQEVPDMDVSDPASTIVKPNPDPVPSLAKVSKNLTTLAGDANVGDTIQYTVTAKNEGSSVSVWSCTVTDELHVGLTFVAGSVTINGVAATASQYDYNSTTRVLTVRLGDINGTQQKVIVFECKINANAYGETIENTAVVGNEKGDDPKPPIVKDRSPAPVIDDVLETDPTVTGTGDKPGAKIVVTFPDGNTAETTVKPDNTWEVTVPPNTTLHPGDEIKAVQTVDDLDTSEDAKTIVIADTAVDPRGNITWVNWFGGQSAKAGDTIEYQAEVWNDGTTSSVWQSAVAIVKLHDDTTFADAVKINGFTVGTNRYNYNSSTHTLTIYLGNIIGQGGANFYFRATVNDNVPDTVTELTARMILTSST